jgi:hypothetical protein
MSSKFEKLIEYVINDEEQKARDLFHEIVVEKSRGIYEDLMAAELKEESDEDLEEPADEEMEESMEMETMGGRSSAQLMQDISADETAMEDDEEVMDLSADEEMVGGDDFADEMGADTGGDLEGDIASIDSKLDELLAKFEEVIGGDDGMVDGEEDDEMTMGSEAEAEEEEVEESLAENVQLQKVAVDHGDRLAGQGTTGGDKLRVDSKSPNANNAGASVTGSVAKPASSKFTAENPDGTRAPTTQKAPDIESGLQNTAGKNMAPMKPATKPTLSQASGVNTKSPLKAIKS